MPAKGYELFFFGEKTMLARFKYNSDFFTGGLLSDEIGISFNFDCHGINYVSLLDTVFWNPKKNNATKQILPWGNTSQYVSFVSFSDLGLNYKFLRNEEGKDFLYPRCKDYLLAEIKSVHLKKEDRICDIIDAEIINFSKATHQEVENFINFLVLKKALNVRIKQKAIHSAFCNPLHSGGINYYTRKVRKTFISGKKEIEIYSIDNFYNRFN